MITMVFDETGKCVCTVDDVLEADMFPGAAAVVQVSTKFYPDQVWYDFARSAVVAKTPMRVQVTTNTVSGIPQGTTALVSGSLLVVNDGTLELEVTYPQTIQVVLSHLRHIERVVEVPCEVQG